MTQRGEAWQQLRSGFELGRDGGGAGRRLFLLGGGGVADRDDLGRDISNRRQRRHALNDRSPCLLVAHLLSPKHIPGDILTERRISAHTYLFYIVQKRMLST